MLFINKCIHCIAANVIERGPEKATATMVEQTNEIIGKCDKIRHSAPALHQSAIIIVITKLELQAGA